MKLINNNFLHLILSFSSAIILFESCEQASTPKPRGFQRIELPKKEYKNFSSDCGFSTSIPVYSTMVTDTFPGSEKCWYNLVYEPFNATLHLSYKPVKNFEDLVKMTEDSRMLVYKHTIRADEIYETLISNEYIHGMLYELSGNTATNFQFFVTDSTHHYLRGALYFNVKTNNDSVAPVLKFLKYDVIKMIESLRWKENS